VSAVKTPATNVSELSNKLSLNNAIISAEALKLKCQHKICTNKAKYNMNLCFTPYYINMIHGIFVQIMI
jgi:hypothetical protein